MVEMIIPPRMKDLGGFSVARILPFHKRRMVGPFIFYDVIGPAEFAAGKGIDVRPHPHIGIATVTYLFEGELDHRDSLGTFQTIYPGDVNWMTTGRGMVHSERTGPAARETVSRISGIQSWVALPVDHAETAPDFVHVPSADLPVVEQDGMMAKVIAGHAFGAQSPVETLSPLIYVDIQLAAGASVDIPTDYEERAIVPAMGDVQVDGQQLGTSHMAVLAPGQTLRVTADQPARLMLLGGSAFPEPRHMWWNFVSHDPARIEQAKADWQQMRFEKVPGETEFIPLPDEAE